MPAECRVVKVSNVAPGATKDQMKTLFGFIGRIDDVVLYPEPETAPTASRVCFVKFEYAEDVGVSLHLSNTVFIDRAVTVVPVSDGKVPDEKTALAADANNPALSDSDDQVLRTVYVSNLSPAVTAEQVIQFFDMQAGEVKYARMAGDEGLGSRAAFVEFTEQASVIHALAQTGQSVGGCLIHVTRANTAIAKPATTGVVGATSKELEQAMKKVNEAQPLISAVLDPDHKSRSRSRSRGSRSKRRSRSRSRRRSRSRSHRSRRRSHSRSKRRSRSPKRRRSRSRSHKRRSRSRSRERRRRSKSRSPKSSKSRRSRSRDRTKKTEAKSRDNTPAESSKDIVKRDDRKTNKESDKDRKPSSRHRSRSPKMSSSCRRSRSRSKSPSRPGRKGRDDRRRSRERSKERSSRSTRDDTKEPEYSSSRGHNGHGGDSDHDGFYGKSSAPKRQRDSDHESDVNASEQKMARNDGNVSEGDGSQTEDDD